MSFLSRIHQFTEKNADLVYLLFRLLAVFALMRAHGLPKILHFQEEITHIPDPIGFGTTFAVSYAIFAHVVGGILVGLGLFTRFFALLIISITLSGLFLVHFNDPVKVQDAPLIYSIVFGFIAFMGGGKYSIDHKIFKS